MPILYILSGPDIGKTYNLNSGATLGRAVECDAILRGASISRKHARLELEGEDWFLHDLDSRNGIHQDGRKKKSIQLEEGATFYVGDLEIRFREQPQGVSLSRSASPPVPASRPDEDTEIELELETEVELEETDGISFEGEELFDQEPAPVSASPVSPAATLPSTPKSGAPAQPKVDAATQRQAERMVAAGIRPQAGGTRVSDGGRPVLQFTKAKVSEGFFSNDLGQYPLWVRIGAGLLGLLLFAAVFYFAFQSANTLKSRAVGQEVEQGAEGFEDE